MTDEPTRLLPVEQRHIEAAERHYPPKLWKQEAIDDLAEAFAEFERDFLASAAFAAIAAKMQKEGASTAARSEALTAAVFHALYGENADPFQNPEAFDFAEKVVARALSETGPDVTQADLCKVGESLTPEDAWQDLVDKDDRTSPEDYPDMALITREELADYMRSAIAPRPAPQSGGREAALEEVLRDTKDQLRELMGTLMLYDGHVTNPTNREGWSDIDGHDAYMAAKRQIDMADRALASNPAGGEMWEPDDKRYHSVQAKDRVRHWFFKNLNSDQRLALFRLFDLPIDEIGEVRGHQKLALNHVLKSVIPTPPAAEGQDDVERVECPACVGTGKEEDHGPGWKQTGGFVNCSACNGTGKMAAQTSREVIHDILWDAFGMTDTDRFYNLADRIIAALSHKAPDAAGEEKLPCDVRLPPATTIVAGCSMATLRNALFDVNRPRHFGDRRPIISHPDTAPDEGGEG